jgi:hypothetical protein
MNETKNFIHKRETIGDSSKQQLPQRRDRPRNNKEITKAQIIEKPRIGLAAEGLLRCVTQLELAENEGSEKGRHMQREQMKKHHVKLKQSNLSISELYQENMELKRQLVTKSTKASTAHSRIGNMAWLKR